MLSIDPSGRLASDLIGLAGTRELISAALRLGLTRGALAAAGTPEQHVLVPPALRTIAERRLRVREVAATNEVSRQRSLEPAEGHQLPSARRHRWDRHVVEVPWSSAPGSVRICRYCGATKQSIPAGATWKVQFGVLTPSGEYRYTQGGTPACPGFVPALLGPQPRESESEGGRGGVGGAG